MQPGDGAHAARRAGWRAKGRRDYVAQGLALEVDDAEDLGLELALVVVAHLRRERCTWQQVNELACAYLCGFVEELERHRGPPFP